MNASDGDWASVLGGQFNHAASERSFVGGGSGNQASGFDSTIAGGVGNVASGSGATVAGGYDNTADGDMSFVGGGSGNAATGVYSGIIAGKTNIAAGDYSFAGGYNARVRSIDSGSFVWSSSSNLFSSTGKEQFDINAQGGFGLNAPPINSNVAMTIAAPTLNPLYSSIHLRGAVFTDGILISSGDALAGKNNASFYIDQYNGSGHTRRLSIDGTGNLAITSNAYKPGGGSWAASSDGRLKKNVQPLGHALDRMLELKGVTFEYSHPDSGMHPAGTFSGFIAQDVEKVFPNWIGHDNDGYLTVGPQGFEALTVEALREMKTTQDDRVAALEHDNADLRELVAKQTQAISDLRREMVAITSTVDLKSRQVADTGDSDQ
jgi:hypothetical protein